MPFDEDAYYYYYCYHPFCNSAGSGEVDFLGDLFQYVIQSSCDSGAISILTTVLIAQRQKEKRQFTKVTLETNP